ncbi:MAG TPA: glycerol dehydrogenase [Gammaproteobacteria bacterium]|nr:glycerol dehydrogenase [Gammaproteobacteria bacterium]
MNQPLFSPQGVYAQGEGTPPRVISAPQRYIQGAGVLKSTGHYVKSLLRVSRPAIFASRRGLQAQGLEVEASLKANGINSVTTQFGGECSLSEIDSHSETLREEGIDCLIAIGGGKVADTGKCIAHRLEVPVVVVPTLAATDAPCSALSVVYTPQGTTDHVEFFPQNPEMIVVDTDVIANAGERYLVAGMGDAMATWYEADTCLHNPMARNTLGALPTLASVAIGEICARTLFEFGEAAAESVRAKQNSLALDKVVEANTLLSGLGFESGGLALAHAIAGGYPEVKVVHDNYLHGEMVAMGVMAQLAMQNSPDRERVARFFARVGLPIHLNQLSISAPNRDDIDKVIKLALSRPIAKNMPMPVTHATIKEAILSGDKLGLAVTNEIGDGAYRRLHD